MTKLLAPFSSLTLRRRSVLAAPALVLPERAHAWTHGTGGSPPPPPGSNRITEASEQRITEDGNNRVTQ